mgnify:CR=1 FL=1
MKLQNICLSTIMLIVSLLFVNQGIPVDTMLLGTWVELKVTPLKKNENLFLLPGATNEFVSDTLVFCQHGAGYNRTDSEKFHYRLQNGDLMIGNRGYKISKITDQQLILIDDTNRKITNARFIYEYIKLK